MTPLRSRANASVPLPDRVMRARRRRHHCVLQGPARLYDGPALPDTSVATLSTESSSKARYYAVDDRRTSGKLMQVKPGSHDVWARYVMYMRENDYEYKAWTYSRFGLDLEAGATYELRSTSEPTERGVSGTRAKVGVELVEVARKTVFTPEHCRPTRPDV